jgi:hypothetical protein
MEWTYQGKPYNPETIPDDLISFVYIIENIDTGQKYIGKKGFWSATRKTVTLKNKKKKKKRVFVPSDWVNYYGSSADFTAEVDKNGKDRYRREILHLCYSKGAASYLEAAEQIKRHVLFDDSYSNKWISFRCRAEHMKKYSIPNIFDIDSKA